MTRSMGDSVDVREIPTSVDIVATYINGSMGVVPLALLEDLFPSSHYTHIFIDVNGSRPDAHVRDWENGDKAGSLEQWVIDHNHRSGKKDAVIYCDRSTISEVRRLTGTQILNQDYFLWVSTLDGTIFQGEGVIACQNRGAVQNGKNFDSSVVFNDTIWPFPSAKPPVAVKPDCRGIQRALRVEIDNLWGQMTDNAGNALIAAWNERFPEGVFFAQHVVGVFADGLWGPNSVTAMHDTTASVQRALIVMGYSLGRVDGIWGPNTSEAYMNARKACHI